MLYDLLFVRLGNDCISSGSSTFQSLLSERLYLALKYMWAETTSKETTLLKIPDKFRIPKFFRYRQGRPPVFVIRILFGCVWKLSGWSNEESNKSEYFLVESKSVTVWPIRSIRIVSGHVLFLWGLTESMKTDCNHGKVRLVHGLTD